MKKLVILIFGLLFAAGYLVSRAQSSQSSDETADVDSTVSVIGWFSKCDTLEYWILQGEWKIDGADTLKTTGIATKVRIVVTDSTSEGYKMDYTFLEIEGDTIENSLLNNIQNRITEKLGRKIIGHTVHFETDELGEITRITNLDKIKKQVKSLFNSAMSELASIPEIKEVKKYGIDITKLADKIDSDQLVEGYLEELKLMFLHHGSRFYLGKRCVHEDATETKYENDVCTTVGFDSEDGSYFIATDVENIIPPPALKAVLGEVVGTMMSDDLAEAVKNEMDSQIKLIGIVGSYLRNEYLGDGWPYSILKQESSTINGQGKLRQTYMYLAYYSVRN